MNERKIALAKKRSKQIVYLFVIIEFTQETVELALHVSDTILHGKLRDLWDVML